MGAKGWAGRMWPTETLIKQAQGAGVDLGDVERHFRVQRKANATAIELRELGTELEGAKVRGEVLKIPTTPESARLAAEVARINELVRRHSIETTPPTDAVELRRSFMVDFDLHGRFYATGGGYQHFKGGTRAERIFVDDETCIEIDVSASHLTCIAGFLGLPFDPTADPYAGLEGIPDRRVAKSWVTSSIGRGEAVAGPRWPRRLVEDARRDGLDLTTWDVTKVGAAVCDRWPVLKDLPDRFGFLGARYGVRPQRTLALFVMALEARALTAAMLDLADRDVAALPVHDSLIIKASDEQVARGALRGAFERTLGVTPRLKASHQG